MPVIGRAYLQPRAADRVSSVRVRRSRRRHTAGRAASGHRSAMSTPTPTPTPTPSPADDRAPSPSRPPGAWAPVHAAAQRLLSPIQRFLAVEAASGIVLIAATAIALAWANSPWAASYTALWQSDLSISL